MQCLLCGKHTQEAHHLCTHCKNSLPIIAQGCVRCGRNLSKKGEICGQCLKKPPPFERAAVISPYQPPINYLIHALKFQSLLSTTRLFSHLLIEKFYAEYTHQGRPDILIPMPLHPHRLRQRGFNQVVEIARMVAKALSIPVDCKGVKRVKHTKMQRLLSAPERHNNMRLAFKACANYKGMTIALLDDVITTGATINDCCRAIKFAGADQIHVWAIAMSL
mgnify:FL=1